MAEVIAPSETAAAVSSGGPLPDVPTGTADRLLSLAAAARPDAPAVIVPGGEELTFAQLDERADAYARGLRRLLGDSGAVVLLSAAMAPDFGALYHGIIRSGNTVAPVNPFYPPHLLKHVAALSGARAAIVTPEAHDRLAAFGGELPQLEHLFTIGEGARALLRQDGAPAGDGTGTACLLFTSGSTGSPKAVRLSHRNLLTGAVQLAAAHGQGPDSLVLNGLPIYHPMHLNASLHAGATHVLSGHDIGDALRHADDHRATHFYTLPFRLVAAANAPEPPGPAPRALRMLSTGGAPLRPAVLRRLEERIGAPVLQGYGLSETSSLATSDRLDTCCPGSVGRPLPGSRLRVVDPRTGVPLPAGELGEIQVQGPNVMQGYLTTPSAVDAEGWLSTSDIGRLDAAGNVFFLDRVRDVFEAADGALVSPGQIEALLDELPEVAESAVVDAPAGDRVRPVAYLVTRGPADAADLLRRANSDLTEHQQLLRVRLVDALPRLPNGKLDRSTLRGTARESATTERMATS
ncbi:class I adenylate-forming enzyme family protein [Kitasatospora griseola]|uniref:class I adenylate-forming enzyme family protein n=1 Tax=Kitasatospora griseola TaxID=2064 RepID=UPI003448BBAC